MKNKVNFIIIVSLIFLLNNNIFGQKKLERTKILVINLASKEIVQGKRKYLTNWFKKSLDRTGAFHILKKKTLK